MEKSSLKKATQGYTLVVVAALMIAATTFTAYTIRHEAVTVTATKQSSSVDNLQELYQAIIDYRRNKGSYPCPAPLNVSGDSTGAFGESANCALASPPGGSGITDLGSSGVWRGMVPVTELGLSRDMAEDNWGNKILYAVDKGLAKDSRGVEIRNTSNGLIRENDFVLIVTGEDAIGAWGYFDTGQDISCPGTSAIGTEKRHENCDNDTIFLDQPILSSTESGLTEYYDDTVYYRDRSDVACPLITSHAWGACTSNNIGGGIEGIFGDPAELLIDSSLTQTGSAHLTCGASGAWSITNNIACDVSPNPTVCPGTEAAASHSPVCDDGVNIASREATCTGYGTGFSFFHFAMGSECSSGTRANENFKCCNPVCPNNAAVSWTAGANTCNATVTGTATQRSYGQPGRAVSDATLPTLGSGTATCQTDGTWAASGTCTVPSCPTTNLSWTVGSNTCTASFGSVTTGNSRTATDSTLHFTGTATASCTGTTWGTPSGSCIRPSCGTANLSWTVGSDTCTASFGSVSSGNSRTATDSVGPTGGTATAACTGTSWGTPSGTCTTPPPPPATCAASETITWTVGSDTCTASSGASGTFGDAGKGIVDSTVPTTGAATITCNSAGNWAVSGTSCTSAIGRAYSWGRDGSNGQLGNGAAFTDTPTPSAVDTTLVGTNVTMVGMGGTIGCVLNSSNRAYCFGNNASGRTGRGTWNNNYSTPQLVAGGITWSAVTSGRNAQCGLNNSGRAYCWGEGYIGGIGNGSYSDRNAPVAVSGSLEYTSIYSGMDTVCAIRPDASARCWGRNTYGELGRGGGSSNYATPQTVIGGLSWAEIEIGEFIVCGVTTSGGGHCWGRGDNHGLGYGSTAHRNNPGTALPGTWQTISPGQHFACGLRTNGDLYCWGRNDHGRTGRGLTSGFTTTPTKIGGTRKFIDVTAGSRHACAIDTNKDAYCWGLNTYGATGRGITGGNTTVPTRVSGTNKFFTIDAGLDHTIALAEPPTFCPTSSLSWGAGCSASFTSVINGSSRTATNSAGGYTGSATASCTGTTWGTPGGSCNANCPTQTRTWGGGNCSASYSGTTHGNNVARSNVASGYSGSATFRCLNGSWSLQGGSSCSAIPTSCPTATLSWGAGCSASFGSVTSGNSRTATDSTGPTTGTATASCSGTTWGTPSGSCGTAPSSCSTATLSWGGGCSASFGGVTSGDYRTATNTASGYTGSATATCSGTSWGTPSGTCASTSTCPGPLNYGPVWTGTIGTEPAYDYWCNPSNSSPGSAPGSTRGPCTMANVGDRCLTHSSGRRGGPTTARIWECQCFGCFQAVRTWGAGCSATWPTQSSTATTLRINTASGFSGDAFATCSHAHKVNGQWQWGPATTTNCSAAGTTTWKVNTSGPCFSGIQHCPSSGITAGAACTPGATPIGSNFCFNHDAIPGGSPNCSTSGQHLECR